MSQHFFSIFPHENLVDLSMVQYGWEQCASLYSYGPYVRNNYLFHYVISGKGYLEVLQPDQTNKRFDIERGQGFLICPGQVTTYCADEHDPWFYTWVEFTGAQAQYRLGLAEINDSQPLYIPLQKEASQKVQDELLYISNHAQESSLHLMAHFYLFLDALIETSSYKQRVRGQSQQSFYIHEAIHYIEQYYRTEIRVEQIATYCGLNRTYFSRLFKEVIGQTPQDYLANYRISKAIELMRNTNMSIGEIANMVGYPNQLYFSKVFRKIHGIPPRTFRQEDALAIEQERQNGSAQ